jgi:hypothetical protein
VTWLVHLTENFATDFSASSFSVGHEPLVRRNDSRSETISKRSEFFDSLVNTKTRLGYALDFVDKWLSFVVVFQNDSDVRELGFVGDLVRFHIAFLFENLDDFEFDSAVRNVNAHHLRSATVPNTC